MSSKLWTDEQFNCPVCLDLPNDPVTIPCGHNYCMACIKDYWSKPDAKGQYSCPQCRKTYSPKPDLARNTMLAEVVEQLRKGGLKPPDAARDSVRSTRSNKSSSGNGKKKLSSAAVACDLCRGQKRQAVKSCLECMSSYCEACLKPHKTQAALKKHELIAPTGQLAEKICTQHKYLQEFFCRQCRVFVCWLCTSNQHKGHECVSTKVEREERQKGLSLMQAQNNQRLKDREFQLREMKHMMEVMKQSSERVNSDTELVLSELQRSIERLQELVEDVMERSGLEKMMQAQEATEGLEAELKVLKKRDTEMKELVSCEDHIHFLQTCESLSEPLETGDLPSVTANPEASYEPVRDAILELRETVEDLCNKELNKITKHVNDTALFTLGDGTAKRGDAPKGSISKLFGLGSSRNTNNNTNNRSQAPTPTVSVNSRGPERRGLGVGLRTQDVRSRDMPQDVRSRDVPQDRGSGNSPRPRDKPRREERESVRSTSSRSSPAPSPRPSPTLTVRSTSSRSSIAPSPRPSPTPSRRESLSLWNRSNRNHTPISPPPTPEPAPLPVPAVVPAPKPTITTTPASTAGFSRMASISSLFRSHRRATPQATPIAETPIEVNPSLFLDLSMSASMSDHMAFPALREINMDSIQAPEPRTREEFLQYAVSLTLDTNTAHRRLALSDGNTKATLQGSVQPYPDTPQRFDGWTQVLCQGPVYGQRSYWEMEWRGRGSSLGVAYGAMGRKGSDTHAGLGYNAQSWSLEVSDTCCSAMHDNEKRDIPVTYSPRVGVFLDLTAGTLSFYGVAESMSLLHSFRANFTQPVYAAFGVGSGVGVGLDFALGQFSSSTDSIKICPM